MSSPATAGVVALMLEANPNLTPGDVRTILEWTAREDNDTGSLPVEGDLVWGHGKVTASQAVMTSLGWVSNVGLPYVPAPEDGQELLVYPNPVTDVMWVAGMTTLQGTWTLLDTQGQMVRSGAATPWFKVSVEGLPEGLYVLQTTGTDGDVRTARIVKRH